MTTIHAGDCSTDCVKCQAQCDCMKCEQTARIKEGVALYYQNPDDYNVWELEDIFEDRDPFEFI